MADVREAICKSTILKKYFALKSGDLWSHWMSPKREIILLGSLPVVQERAMLIRPLFLSYGIKCWGQMTGSLPALPPPYRPSTTSFKNTRFLPHPVYMHYEHEETKITILRTREQDGKLICYMFFHHFNVISKLVSKFSVNISYVRQLLFQLNACYMADFQTD